MIIPTIKYGPSPCQTYEQGSVQTPKKKMLAWVFFQCLIEVIDEGGEMLEKERQSLLDSPSLKRKFGKKY